MTRTWKQSLAAACSTPPPSESTPDNYLARAVQRTDGALQVSAAVLSAEESEATYGVPLAQKSIQPVWIEVRNGEDQDYFLLSPGLDPNFFPASEAAEAFSAGLDPKARQALAARFRQLAFRNPVHPGQTVSGFVLTHLTEGAKLVQLDLVTNGRAPLSSSANNARQIRDAILAMPVSSQAPRLVLIGYSKGAADILEAVAAYPEIRGRVAAVVSAASAVGGSPLANDAEQYQADLLRHFPGAKCTSGGGGGVESLRTGVRRA